MRTTLIIKRCVQVVLLGAALASPVMAQPGPGWGGGWCGGPGMQGAGGMPGPGWGCGMGQGGGRGMYGGRGMGYRMGAGMAAGTGSGMGPGAWGGRGVAANQNLTRGWELMTPQERTEQQTKMRAVKTYDECIAVQTEHRGKLEIRAKEKGLTLVSPPASPCDNLKARGLIQ